ncbi:MAG: DNA polymerase III subunit gamma/tau [Oscillospiraceae bacterium]|nr:DNA polymerase III subunit gamma/tau [Oscillospiraceae bacterium]
MYQALYRKYRPRRFGDVTGQEHITETLLRQLITGRLSHAYLFVGTRGTGKTTCAKILSRAVNCQSPEDGEPCNKCTACVGIEDGSILDVLELDAASNNSVDNVRALRDEAVYSPAAVKKRVYIVDEVHMLSISAFNALLKILEEPPEYILFILATTELHKVPATIQGRCQKFSFKRLLPSTLAERLRKIASNENLSLADDAAEKLALLADGSMRDAISLLDQCAYSDTIDLSHIKETLGLAGQSEILNLMRQILSCDIISALKTLDDLYNDGRDMASLLNELTSLMRDILVYKLSADSNLLLSANYSFADLSDISKAISNKHLFDCLDVLKTTISGQGRSGTSKLTAEMCLLKMCDIFNSEPQVSAQAQVSASTQVQAPPPQEKQTQSPAPLAQQEAPAEQKTVPEPDFVLEQEVTPPAPSVEPPSAEPPSVEPSSIEPPATEPPKPSGDFWKDTLKMLNNEPSLLALLNDSSKVQPSLQDNILCIKLTDSFTANLIESGFSELLKTTVSKVLGRDIIINFEVTDQIKDNDSGRNKLESLSAFGVVNFE